MGNKIIAFLGPDRVGKTTMAKRLFESKKQNGDTLLFHGREPLDHHVNLYDQYTESLDWVSEGKEGRTLVLDRCWIDSLVYEGSRKGCEVDFRSVFEYECDLLRNYGVPIVYNLVRANWSTVSGRHSEEVLTNDADFPSRLYKEKMLARRYEHSLYYKVVVEYLDDWSLFPYCIYERTFNFE